MKSFEKEGASELPDSGWEVLALLGVPTQTEEEELRLFGSSPPPAAQRHRLLDDIVEAEGHDGPPREANVPAAGLLPDEASYANMMRKQCTAGNLERAEQVFERLLASPMVQLKRRGASPLLGLYCQRGQLHH